MNQYDGFNKGLREGKKQLFKQIKELIINWDIEPCCYGLKQTELIEKLNNLFKESDKRYKLSQNDVDKIGLLRKEGYSKNQIAEIMKISISTVCYWTNKEFREHQKNKNRKKINSYLPNFKKKIIPVDEVNKIK